MPWSTDPLVTVRCDALTGRQACVSHPNTYMAQQSTLAQFQAMVYGRREHSCFHAGHCDAVALLVMPVGFFLHLWMLQQEGCSLVIIDWC